ncbi:MAG: 2Fe-2S iron-sulfur cluster-binding protein [Phycisphaerales bacterium]
MPPPPEHDSGVSRRSFLQTLGVSAAANSLAVAGAHAVELAEAAPTDDGPVLLGPEPARVVLRVNGKEQPVTIDPGTTLMDALRLKLDLTGTKDICDRGSCGGCCVIMDGKLVNSCMTLAADAIGADVRTIEGLADGERLHPLQQAFVKHDALQCGYCTPGLVMACKAVLDKHPKPTLQQIKHGLAGNICRCGTYTNVFNACLEASGQEPLIDK